MNHRANSGFTIVEIAVVLAVIGVITAMIAITFNQTQKSARDDRITADITALKRAVVSYYNDNGSYPTCSSPGTCTVQSISSRLNRYMNSVPTNDPSGRNYEYASSTQPDQYGLAVFYQSGSQCKTGSKMTMSWWGSLPDCSGIYPNRF